LNEFIRDNGDTDLTDILLLFLDEEEEKVE